MADRSEQHGLWGAPHKVLDSGVCVFCCVLRISDVSFRVSRAADAFRVVGSRFRGSGYVVWAGGGLPAREVDILAVVRERRRFVVFGVDDGV